MPSRYRGPEDEQLALASYVKLLRASESVETRVFRRLATVVPELTSSQFAVLEALHHIGPMHQCDLARRNLRSSGNMTLVIDNLEKRGLVRRERSADDRRFVRVELTADGAELIGRIFPGHARAIADEFAVLSAEEQRVLGDLCRRVGRGERSEALLPETAAAE